MPEWGLVIMLGAVGGIVSTVFLGGAQEDVPLPPLLDAIEDIAWLYVPYRFLQSALLGSLASFLLWASHSSAKFDSTGIVPLQVASAIISGGAGGPIVNSFFQRAQNQEVVTRLTNSVEELLER